MRAFLKELKFWLQLLAVSLAVPLAVHLLLTVYIIYFQWCLQP